MSKFEQLLDYLVNEEREKADELFHEIVVEKSREIYENLIAEEETEEDEVEEASKEDEDESVEEASDDEEDDSVEESQENDEDETVESMFDETENDDNFAVQDKTDSLDDEVTDNNPLDSDEGGLGDEEGVEDPTAPADKGDIQDLEDALEELKAEFANLVNDQTGGDEFGSDTGEEDLGGDVDGSGDEFASDESEDEKKVPNFESKKAKKKEIKGAVKKSQGETMREYIEKIKADMDGGLVGARTGETVSAPKEGKSPISSGAGKPTSGANAKNVAQAGKGDNQDGTKPHGKAGGLLKTGGELRSGGYENTQSKSRNTKNIWGAAKKPANKEGQGVGANTGNDKAGQTGGNTNTRSIESGK